MNGAQRCELHNRAVFRWVGGSACRVLLLPFWSRATLRATFKKDHGLFSARAPSANGGVWRLAQEGPRRRATSRNRHPLRLVSRVPFAPGVPAAGHCFLRGHLPDGNIFMNVTNAYDALMFPGWVPENVRRRRRCLEDASGWHMVTSAE